MLIASFLIPVGAYADEDDKKVTICHVPPGNPENAHTIVVSANAVDAHLAHGDYLGECQVTEPDPDPEPEEPTYDPCKTDGRLCDTPTCADGRPMPGSSCAPSKPRKEVILDVTFDIEKPKKNEAIVSQTFDGKGKLIGQKVGTPIPQEAQQEGM